VIVRDTAIRITMKKDTHTNGKTKAAGRVSISVTGFTPEEIELLRKRAELADRTVSAEVRNIVRPALNFQAA